MPLTAPLTITLPQDTSDRLDRLAQETRQTPLHIIHQALDAHLDALERASPHVAAQDRYARLRRFQGAIAKLNGPRSKEDIDSDIRRLRDDD